MPLDPVDREKLLNGLNNDLNETAASVAQSSQGRGEVGSGDQEQQYLPKAIRYKGAAIHQQELGDLHNLIDRATEHIIQTNNQWSTAEKAKMRYELNDKLHQYSMDVLNKTMQFGNHLKDMQLDQEQQASALNMWAKMASGVTAGIVGYGKGGGAPQNPALTQMQYPGSGQPQAANLSGQLPDPYMGA